ncbi:MAG TPA: hypothetical protein VGB90_08280 [Alphaproteobacteria bacterium]
MALLYAVRCNFARPDLEAAWNVWYDGPKTAEILAMPLFVSGQRFVASGLDTHRKYLALWVVESADVFTTPEYKAGWGFHEWQDHIRDWSRDLYPAPAGDASAKFAVDDASALHLVSFDGASLAEARALRDRVAAHRPGVTWMEAIGLDRHSPVLGVASVPRGTAPAPLAVGGVQETLFDPISPCVRARAAAT